jgi:P-type Cu+ transporter
MLDCRNFSGTMEKTKNAVLCDHCGEPCPTDRIVIGEKRFCCEGCRMVYQLLDRNGLCSYYQLNDHPGQNLRIPVRKDKFAFLDDEKMAGKLITFRDAGETHASFYLPAIHCSSCLYLLENLRRINPAIGASRIDFAAKEITLIFDQHRITLRGVAELLTSLGYEPYISLRDLGQVRPGPDRGLIYRLGVAGFCFGNIMLLSFPEYLGLDKSDALLRQAFRFLGLFLSLPVLLYCAQPFYRSAWSGLRHRFLNIDAPIVLAIFVTFARGAWEVLGGAGSGYFDSMSGIVFFMLAGRVLQDRTYRQLSFDRDYTSYFPMAVTVLPAGDLPTGETTKSLPELRCGDTLLIHNGELIPADGILTRGQAFIDYSFVTGESLPVSKDVGEIVYAGGRQTGGAIEVLVIKEVAQSYLTQLWNRQPSRPMAAASGQSGMGPGRSASGKSFIDALSRYFTVIVFTVAASAAVYWQLYDPARTWTAVTAVLIVACPCALLLSSTFTNGNLLRVMARHHFYLRNAETIERIAAVNHIVFDKTGTLTDTSLADIVWRGVLLFPAQELAICALAAQSTHPLSRALARRLRHTTPALLVRHFAETPGRGIEGRIGEHRWAIGSLDFVSPAKDANCPALGLLATAPTANRPIPPALTANGEGGPRLFVACNGHLLGAYHFSSHYHEGIEDLGRRLAGRYRLSLLSGDTARERRRLQQLLGRDATLLFGQTPMGKCDYIQRLRREGERVMMVGDGLNDAAALQQSDAGIAISADCAHFTPASDAILRADQLPRLPDFLRLCRSGRRIILGSFLLSVLYNIVGLGFAVSGSLSPLRAAILMPASSLSILLVTFGSTNLLASRLLRKIMPIVDKGHSVPAGH